MKYRNVKLKVLSQEHSAAFQESAFESGARWQMGEYEVRHTKEPYIFVDEGGFLAYACSREVFDIKDNKQIHFITPAYKMTKIRVRNPEHSEFVQKKLFENGCSWMGGFTDSQHTDKPCLTVSETGEIRFCTASFFDEQAHLTEIFIEDDFAEHREEEADSNNPKNTKISTLSVGIETNVTTRFLGTETSDGSTASYYELPSGATELQHLISHKDMNAQIGEIFRSCYRYGQASHSDKLRDAKKIQFYINAEIERLEKCKP